MTLPKATEVSMYVRIQKKRNKTGGRDYTEVPQFCCQMHSCIFRLDPKPFTATPREKICI